MTQRAETIRRIQIGLLGLGVVVAMLVIGGAILSRLRTDPTKPLISLSAKSNDKQNERTKEFPAKLGIAPADVQENIAEGAKNAKIH
jgi:hypothetical protein